MTTQKQNSEVARPSPALEEGATPEVARPSPALGDAATPEVATPSPALGDAATPEVATPKVARPSPALGDVAQPSQSQPQDAFTKPSSSIGYFPGKSIYDDELLKTHRGENHLPHWELDETIYHVCFRLNDAVPKQKQEEWRYERELLQNLAKSQNRELSEDEKKRLQYLYSDKIEQYLDTGYGECLLKMPQVAQIVKQSLEFYNNVKYILHCWCIMPNHVHAAFKLLETGELPKVLHGWKSYTAHVINKLLGRSNTLWQADYYNHIIRSGNEYYQQINYIWNNPDKAGLRNWPWRGKITKQN